MARLRRSVPQRIGDYRAFAVIQRDRLSARGTHVKFYRRSFFDVVEDQEGRFEGFIHVDDWVPQRLVTATGPNALPR